MHLKAVVRERFQKRKEKREREDSSRVRREGEKEKREERKKHKEERRERQLTKGLRLLPLATTLAHLGSPRARSSFSPFQILILRAFDADTCPEESLHPVVNSRELVSRGRSASPFPLSASLSLHRVFIESAHLQTVNQ